MRASDLRLPVNPGARAYVLPCIAGHVGADTAGVILSEAPHDQEQVNLIVDVGTNAEIVLGNRERLLAASSPTGPALEGAQISCGQRAAPGAIERVRIDPETLEPRIRVIGTDAWSDEPGFEGTRVTGVCGSGIVEVVAELLLAGILTTDGTIDGSLAERSPRIVGDGRTFAYVLHDGEPELRITQNDVRQVQLAKAALHAGCTLSDGALRDRPGRPHPPRRRVRHAHRPHVRARARARPRLRPGRRDRRRQRRRNRRAHRIAQPRLPCRDRRRRAAGREDRDGDRAALPGAVRRRDGDPPRHRPLSPARAGRHAAPADGRRASPSAPTGRRRRRAAALTERRPT